MKIKKKFLALIIVAILIISSLLVVSINNAVQGSRVAMSRSRRINRRTPPKRMSHSNSHP